VRLKFSRTTRRGYQTRLQILRAAHGHRTVIGLTRERIEEGILKPDMDRPGAALSLLKMLRILIRYAMSLDSANPLHLDRDPSVGIKRPKRRQERFDRGPMRRQVPLSRVGLSVRGKEQLTR
jgi:enterobacteria phage integrase